MKATVSLLFLSLAIGSAAKPNVLFLAIDDQNDWIGHLGGHPLVKTPHLDALAKRGTTFLNAHCQAPVCNPSRTSLIFGLRPGSSGVYGLSPAPRTVPLLKNRKSLFEYFAGHGYRTYATGKIFHAGTRAGPKVDPAKEFDVTARYGGVGNMPKKKLVANTPMGDHPLVDWGIWPPGDDDSSKGDYQVASWVCEQILNAPDDEPFFIAGGFFLPHVPCFTTRKWHELYPGNDRLLPPVLDTDRKDTPRFSWYMHWCLPEPRLSWVKRVNQWESLTRSYLACTSFTDHQIGRVLEALEQSGKSSNTLVVVWSDHGWHLGEKGITGKNTLWDRSTRVPLIFAGPGVTSGQACRRPAELLDIYPTLVGLAGLAEKKDLEGLSLQAQLKDADAARDRPAITTHNPGNHGVRSEKWRYIRYADGSEELYDMEKDPNEWYNLIGKAGYETVIKEHRKWIPTTDLPLAAGSGGRILSYDPATDTAVWEKTTVKRTDPIPE